MKTMTVNKPEKALMRAGWLIALLVACAGIGVAWYLQLNRGMGVTGLSAEVVWGLYIAAFYIAAGAGVGLVILAALGEIAGQFKTRHRESMLLLALTCFVTCGILIFMDLGNLSHILKLVTSAKFSSLITWDFWALALTSVLTLAYLMSARIQNGSIAATRTLGLLAALCGLVALVIESWMLSSLSARPFWGSALLVVQFLTAAVVSALACAILAWKDTAARLARWLSIALTVALGLVLVEVLTDLMSGNPRLGQEINLVLANPYFWLQIGIGLLAPLALLMWRKGCVQFTIAAGLALLGVLFEKTWILAAGQTLRWLDLPAGSYMPTWIEWLGVAGAAALTVALYFGLKEITGLHDVNV